MAAAESAPARSKLLPAGETAPNFVLKDQSGADVRLSDFRGRKVVLYFYPKSFTAGCTAEACQFRDAYEDFRDAGAEVIGVSNDDVSTQERFVSQKKLPFVLLSDPDETAHKLYGVRPAFGLVRGRATFIIDEAGVVRYAFESVNPNKHVPEALRRLQSLS